MDSIAQIRQPRRRHVPALRARAAIARRPKPFAQYSSISSKSRMDRGERLAGGGRSASAAPSMCRACEPPASADSAASSSTSRSGASMPALASSRQASSPSHVAETAPRRIARLLEIVGRDPCEMARATSAAARPARSQSLRPARAASAERRDVDEITRAAERWRPAPRWRALMNTPIASSMRAPLPRW